MTCDLEESYGRYVIGRDEEVMTRLSSANVACGFHAGDMQNIDELSKGGLNETLDRK